MASKNRPYVLINVAATADGKIDTFERRGATISSARDKERVDRLRAAVDAVMVGGRTLVDEDPRLIVKSKDLRAERVARGLPENPAKVGVVSRLNMPLDSRFFTAGPARTILFTTARTTADEIAPLQERGVEVYALGDTRVDLTAALARLSQLGIQRMLVEGGATLNFELLRLRLVDEVRIYVAPLLFGGATAPTLAAGNGLPAGQGIRLERRNVEVWDDGGIVLEYTVAGHQ